MQDTNGNDTRQKRPAPFDYDAEWDAEAMLRSRQSERETVAQQQETEPPAQIPRRQPRENVDNAARSRQSQQRRGTAESARRPSQRSAAERRKRRRRAQIRGWTILIALILVALLVLGGLIYLVVGAILPEKTVPTETSTTEEPTETTVPREEVIAGLLKRSDFLAAGYDYDAAIAVLTEFGPDWQQQPELKEANDRYLAEKAKTVRWADTTQITHIFFHSLIVDTDRAFDSDFTASGYNQYMATVTEFRAILEELYRRGYVLVRIHDIAVPKTDANGNTVYEQGDIFLPPGKTPIIISQDDVNY